jgi:DNA-binding NarL/FixJ family response regulator
MKKLRVVLAEDHEMVRDGLKLLINGQPDMQVVGEAGSGKQAVEKALNLKPDVVVMDLTMPGQNGLQAAELLASRSPPVKVVALTMHEDPSYLRQLCQAKAVGYVLKRSAADHLVRAIREVASGGLWFDATLAAKALATQAPDAGAKRNATTSELSEREKEVLHGVAWGYSNKELADLLGLSVKTVETYKVRVAEKLGLRSRAEMVQYCLRQGWLKETRPPFLGGFGKGTRIN